MEHGWQQIALSLWSFSPQFILVWLRRVYRILGVTFLFFANWRMTVSVHALLLLKSLLIFLWTFRILCFQFWKENSWRLFDRWGVIMLVMVLRSLEAKISQGCFKDWTQSLDSDWYLINVISQYGTPANSASLLNTCEKNKEFWFVFMFLAHFAAFDLRFL